MVSLIQCGQPGLLVILLPDQWFPASGRNVFASLYCFCLVHPSTFWLCVSLGRLHVLLLWHFAGILAFCQDFVLLHDIPWKKNVLHTAAVAASRAVRRHYAGILAFWHRCPAAAVPGFSLIGRSLPVRTSDCICMYCQTKRKASQSFGR